jgi:cell division protein FtsW
MLACSRDSSKIVKWWCSVDHAIIFTIVILLTFGIISLYSGSYHISHKLNLDVNYFFNRQLVFILLGAVLMIFFSMLELRILKRVAVFSFVILFLLLIVTLISEPQLKGAKRWLSFFGVSIQISEIMKPFFIVLNAWFLSKKYNVKKSPNYRNSFLIYFLTISLILMQPDFGQTILLSAVWGAQIFLSGIALKFIALLCVLAIMLALFAYLVFPHVRYRINIFTDDNEINYQVQKSLDAINSGGIWGRGISEGKVRNSLPDSHTDFIFAVIVEELGMIFAVFLIMLYFLLFYKIYRFVKNHPDDFIKLAALGLILMIIFQVIINIGVNINMLPTKGITLPFISYGGSSMISSMIMIGVLLCLTRRRYGQLHNREKYYIT